MLNIVKDVEDSGRVDDVAIVETNAPPLVTTSNLKEIWAGLVTA